MTRQGAGPRDPDAARPYRMARRAELVAATRRRIVEATVRLHERVGLRATTVSAVAGEAGVTRATVYRHFPDDASLYAACSAHWLSRQSPPDPTAWAGARDAPERLRAGLADVYRFYRSGASMLANVTADADVLPEPVRRAREALEAAVVAALGEPMGDASRDPRVAAALAHAASFSTWRSLCVERGLSDADAVEVMSAMALALWEPATRGAAPATRR